MSPLTAGALRRATLTGTALAATLIAHALSGPDVRVLPVAPVLWAAMIALAVPLGALRRTAAFTAWRPRTILAALVAVELALHALLSAAPWAFGLLVAHAHGPVLTPRALALHVAVAVVLLVPLCAGQRLLLRALRLVEALLAPAGRRPALPRAALRVSWCVIEPASRLEAHPRRSRGPPAAGPTPAAPPPAPA